MSEPIMLDCLGCPISGHGCPQCPVAVLAAADITDEPDPDYPAPRTRMVPIYRPDDPGLAG